MDFKWSVDNLKTLESQQTDGNPHPEVLHISDESVILPEA